MPGTLTNSTISLHAGQFFTELVSEIHVIVLIMFSEVFLYYAASEIVLLYLETFSVV